MLKLKYNFKLYFYFYLHPLELPKCLNSAYLSLLLAFFLAVTANCKNGKPTIIKEFTINLDLEPSLRLNKFYFYFNY
jgi:hypothetical protein